MSTTTEAVITPSDEAACVTALSSIESLRAATPEQVEAVLKNANIRVFIGGADQAFARGKDFVYIDGKADSETGKKLDEMIADLQKRNAGRDLSCRLLDKTGDQSLAAG